ncbi:MAG: cell wall-binding repeat-containing protein [Peptococcaceae bacterium]|nr:cell wall-binding repeat-containing protein [Peptococcaceae bacterium]
MNNGMLGDGTGDYRSLPGLVVDSLIPDDTRLAGDNRIETAVAISKKMLPLAQSADSVILATSNNFPDAFAGASMGVLNNAPLLLVDPKSDNKTTLDEIQRVLKPGGNIYILGGTGVIPANFETVLKNLQGAYSVKRLAGEDRYSTAAEIAKKVQPQHGGEVIIATGKNFPDSLSISPYAAAESIPMVLVKQTDIPDTTLEYLKDLEPTKITIVGGEGVISGNIENELAEK